LSPISLVVTLLLVIGALTLGGTMIVGDHYLLDEYTDFPPGPKVTAGLDANRLLFYWPESASAVAGAYQWRQEILHLPGSLKMAQPYVQSAVNRDPADPLLRADAGDLQLLLGDRAGAQRLYLQALQRDPWTAQALIGLGTIARDEHEWAASARWLEKAQLVSPPSPTLAQEIRSDLSHLSNPA
jgi:tetratricopeptide (TPR) repeat protein